MQEKAESPWFRWASLGIAVLSLWAVLMPLRADPMEHIGGYRLEFTWHQVRWLTRPFNFEILYLLGGAALLLACVYYSVCFLRLVRLSVFWPCLCLAACIAFRSWCVDVALVSCYSPPFYGDEWRMLAFAGGIASLLGVAAQIAVVVGVYRLRKAGAYDQQG